MGTAFLALTEKTAAFLQENPPFPAAYATFRFFLA